MSAKAYFWDGHIWQTISAGHAANLRRRDPQGYGQMRIFCRPVDNPATDDKTFRVFVRDPLQKETHFAHFGGSPCQHIAHHLTGSRSSTSAAGLPLDNRRVQPFLRRAFGVAFAPAFRARPYHLREQTAEGDKKAMPIKEAVRAELRRVPYPGAGIWAALVRDGQVIEAAPRNGEWISKEKYIERRNAHAEQKNRVLWLWDIGLVKTDEGRASSAQDLRRGATVQVSAAMDLCMRDMGRVYLVDQDLQIYRTSWPISRQKGSADYWREVTLRNAVRVDVSREIIAGHAPQILHPGNGPRKPGLIWNNPKGVAW